MYRWNVWNPFLAGKIHSFSLQNCRGENSQERIELFWALSNQTTMNPIIDVFLSWVRLRRMLISQSTIYNSTDSGSNSAAWILCWVMLGFMKNIETSCWRKHLTVDALTESVDFGHQNMTQKSRGKREMTVPGAKIPWFSGKAGCASSWKAKKLVGVSQYENSWISW